MNPQLSPILATALPIILGLLGLVFLFVFIRLVKGPNLPDRVIVLDFMSVVAVSFMAIFSVWTTQPVFLDVGIALALISFLGTVAFAKYLEKRR